MDKSTIAIMILTITLIFMIMDKLPMVVTALLSALAMVFTGVLTPEQAFSGLSSAAILSVIGFGIISSAFLSSGLSEEIGDIVNRWIVRPGRGEKIVLVICILLAALVSAFFNGLIVILIFMTVIESVEAKSQGKISRKHMFLPLSFASVMGGNLSVIGSSSMITASGIYESMEGGRLFGFWEPATLGIAGVAALLVMYLSFGYRMQERCFDFIPEPPAEQKEKQITGQTLRKKQILVLATLLVSVVCICLGVSIGIASVCAACFLMVTKCVEVKKGFADVDWVTVFILVGVLGMAKGVSDSGAGLVIADTVLKISGPLAQYPYAMCVLFLLIAALLSNIMSNSATVAILIPIATAVAAELGTDGLPYALVCAIGANLAVATPICTTTVAVTSGLGYRFKDYIRVGGTATVLSVSATALILKIVFF